MDNLGDILKDSARPCFLFGVTPPREGTSLGILRSDFICPVLSHGYAQRLRGKRAANLLLEVQYSLLMASLCKQIFLL